MTVPMIVFIITLTMSLTAFGLGIALYSRTQAASSIGAIVLGALGIASSIAAMLTAVSV